ncbi:MAG: oligosaccharide flippase family protein [Clostridia bacterium]|nr:oligosaccharide flippase family protein [Clostridia bacterium]
MKPVKSMFKAVSIITLFAIITRFLGFIFRIYLSNVLGAEGIGIYQIASSIIGVFMTLIASGIPLTTAKMVAKYDNSLKLKDKNITTTSSCVIAVVLSVFSCIILLLGQDFLNIFIKNQTVIDLILIMCPALIFSAVYAVFRGALWGQNSFFWVGFTELLEQIIRLILTFIIMACVVNKAFYTKAVALSFTLTCLLSAIFVIIIYFISGGRLCFSKSNYKEIIKRSAPITGVRLASSFIQPLTALLIPLLLTQIGYSNSQAIGIYGIIMGMAFPLLFAPLSVVGSLSVVLIPKISILESNKKYDAISKSVNSSINFSLFLAVVLIPLYLSCGDLIGVVLFNNLQAGVYLQLSAVCILPLVLNNITSSILNALNLELKSFINYIAGTIVLFVSLISLTFVIREKAIIVSMFLSTATIAFLNLRKIHSAIPNFKSTVIPDMFKYSLIILPCSVLGHLISNVLYHYLPALFAGLIGGGISIISTLMLIKIFKVYDFTKFKIRRNAN